MGLLVGLSITPSAWMSAQAPASFDGATPGEISTAPQSTVPNILNLTQEDPVVQAMVRLRERLSSTGPQRSVGQATETVGRTTYQAYGTTVQTIGAAQQAISLINRLFGLLSKLGVTKVAPGSSIANSVNSVSAKLDGAASSNAMTGLNGAMALVAFVDGARNVVQGAGKRCQFNEVLALGDNAFRASDAMKKVVTMGKKVAATDDRWVYTQNYLSWFLSRYQTHNSEEEAKNKTRQLMATLDQGCNTAVMLHQIRSQQSTLRSAQALIEVQMPMFESWARQSVADVRDTMLPGLIDPRTGMKTSEVDDTLTKAFANDFGLGNDAKRTADVSDLNAAIATADAAAKSANDITTALVGMSGDLRQLLGQMTVLSVPGWDTIPSRGPTLPGLGPRTKTVSGRTVTEYFHPQTCPPGYPNPNVVTLPSVTGKDGLPRTLCGLASPLVSRRVRSQTQLLRATLANLSLMSEPRFIELEGALLTQELNGAKRAERARKIGITQF